MSLLAPAPAWPTDHEPASGQRREVVVDRDRTVAAVRRAVGGRPGRVTALRPGWLAAARSAARSLTRCVACRTASQVLPSGQVPHARRRPPRLLISHEVLTSPERHDQARDINWHVSAGV